MTDDDKTPVDTKCGAPIRARDGSVTSYVCNLPRGHLGRHAEVLQDATVTGLAEGLLLETTVNAK